MDAAIALAIGLLSGAHTATWGMYKDSPHEGFTWRKYLRSIVLSGAIAVVWELSLGFDLARAWMRFVMFGLTYVTERGVVFGLRAFQAAGPGLPGWVVVLAIGSIGGWLSAFGGAFKDAPVEGFETFKFFRSPLVALFWAMVVAWFSRDFLHIALCGLGYTVATFETYKTFFFPNKPRGKFAGKPILFPRFLTWRYRFAPLYAAIWVAVLANLAVAFGEPREGLLGRAMARPASTFLFPY